MQHSQSHSINFITRLIWQSRCPQTVVSKFNTERSK